MTRLLLGAAMLALLAGCATVKQPELDVAVQSSGQIWNAVAHYSGRTFLSGPRWTGTQGPQLTAIDQNGQRALPIQAVPGTAGHQGGMLPTSS
jgi:hypothetical protein